MTTKKNRSISRIGERVRALRKERNWTQIRLAELLGISQSYLSDLEHGKGSFTAEQLLTLLTTFNVPISFFAPNKATVEAQIQNALARQGATHLNESTEVLPSDRLHFALQAIKEALLSASSARQITAIAPILVAHASQINLNRLRTEFASLGLEKRLGWAIENTLEAIKRESTQFLDRDTRLKYRRAEAILESFFRPWQIFPHPTRNPEQPIPYDVVDSDIASAKSLREVRENLPPISQRWEILSRIEVDDFIQALRAARDTHPRIP